jgi:hypothetical protein
MWCYMQCNLGCKQRKREIEIANWRGTIEAESNER